MSVLLDSTLGLVLMYIFLHISSYFIGKYHLTLLYSGEYGRPPAYKVRSWMHATHGSYIGPITALARPMRPLPSDRDLRESRRRVRHARTHLQQRTSDTCTCTSNHANVEG